MYSSADQGACEDRSPWQTTYVHLGRWCDLDTLNGQLSADNTTCAASHEQQPVELTDQCSARTVRLAIMLSSSLHCPKHWGACGDGLRGACGCGRHPDAKRTAVARTHEQQHAQLCAALARLLARSLTFFTPDQGDAPAAGLRRRGVSS
jgi:hypothetical protein